MVLVPQGTDDECGTPEQVHAIVEGVDARANAHLMPGVGHTPHREAADEVLRLTTAFLVEPVPGRARACGRR